MNTINSLIKIMPINHAMSGKDINDTLKLNGWDALSHRGWETYKVLKKAVELGLVEKLPNRKGRAWYRLV